MQNFNFLGIFNNNSNSGSKKRGDKQRRGRTCRIEELENREMLSATPWALADNVFLNDGDIALYTPHPSPLQEGEGTQTSIAPLAAATPAEFNDNDFQKLYAAGLIGESGNTLKGEITWSTGASKRLVSLVVNSAELTGSLDLSGCTALEELNVSQNQLTELDVSGCTALTSLGCFDNQLTKLDVSGCAALAFLSCGYNQLTELDVSENTALETLMCNFNNLQELDVSKNTALALLSCDYNQLTELDVSKNTALTTLGCGSNQLKKLDVSQNTALTRLSCYNNKLKELDVSKNTALTFLDCSDNQLTELDVSNHTALTWLTFARNQLTFSKIHLPPDKLLSSYEYLNYSDQADVKISLVPDNFYWTVDLSAEYLGGSTTFTWYVREPFSSTPTITTDYTNVNGVFTFDSVKEGDVLYCEMTNVNFPELTFLIPGWGIVGVPALLLKTESVKVGPIVFPYNEHDWNKVVSQGWEEYATWGNVNRELRLIELYIPPNSLSGSLDLSGLTALEILSCGSNQLTELDVSGLTALRKLFCSENQLKELDLSDLTALEILSCGSNQLTELNVSGLTALRELHCSWNQLKELDVSGLTALEILSCGFNPLTELGASGLTALISVFCYGDPIMGKGTLTSLNLSGCTALEDVDCFVNNLTMLDLTGCTALKQVRCYFNQLTFSTLPPPGAFEYNYGQSLGSLGQANVVMSIDNDDTVDLSGEYLDGSTTYTWHYADGSIVDSSLYSGVNGVFTFAGLNAADIVYCKMTNVNFPGLILETTKVTIGVGSMKFNAHDWNMVESQNLQAYAIWDTVDGEARLVKLDAGGEWFARGPLTGRLDLSGCEFLTEVRVDYNQLTELDVSGCASLQILFCFDNPLTKLNVSGCTALERLSVGSGQLTELDVSSFTSLKFLSCGWNQLTELDVSKNTALEYLHCGYNQLTFSTLPATSSSTFIYSPQALVPIALSLNSAGKLDLSVENVNGHTTYTWYYAGGTTPAPVTEESPGVFSFTNLTSGDLAYCEMTNTDFPDLTLTTTEAEIFVGSQPLEAPVVVEGAKDATSRECSIPVLFF